jgi:membrane-associated protein
MGATVPFLVMDLLPLLIPLLPSWLDPAALLNGLIQALGNWALWGVAFLVFIECAIWPILPGDSLLFTVGMFVAGGSISFAGFAEWQVLIAACVVLTVAAIAGNVAGYWVGHLIGPALFKPREGFWGKVFDPKYVTKTHEMLAKYGNKALVLARFVPFVRTFITLIAGIGKMEFKTFITWTAVGGVIWGFGVTVLGFFLGRIDFVKNNIEAVLVLIVLVSLLPMAVEAYLQHRKAKAEAAQS